MRASLLRKANKHEAAAEALGAAGRGQSQSSSVLRNLGDSKLQLGDFEGAVRELQRADEIEPNNAFTLRQLGVAYGELQCWHE